MTPIRNWAVSVVIAASSLGVMACGLGTSLAPAITTSTPALTNTSAAQGSLQLSSTATASVAPNPFTAAPISPTPLILLLQIGKGSGGDLWTLTGQAQSLRQLTKWGYNYEPVVSPDGKTVAYLSTAAVVVNAGPGAVGSGFPPATIWLLNPVTDDATRIADQPAGVGYPSDKLIARNTPPAWSPDSSALAWVERDSISTRLMIYDVAKAKSRAITLDLPQQCCEGAFPVVYWGPKSIAVEAFNGTSPDSIQHTIYFMAPDGTRSIPATVPAMNVLGWVVKDGKSYLAGLRDAQTILVDPESGQSSEVAARLEQFAPGAPNGLTVASTADPKTWTISDHGSNVATIGFSRSVAISPDGTQVVYRQSDDANSLNPKAFVYGNGQTGVIAIPDTYRVQAVAWGPVAWRLQ